jgi:hypothetical protein
MVGSIGLKVRNSALNLVEPVMHQSSPLSRILAGLRAMPSESFDNPVSIF